MAKKTNENNHLILSNFANTATAQEAAGALKVWDKATDNIKLGGIALIESVDGKVKVHKAGSRMTGKGAKWGLGLGVLLGIFSGGVTVIGGALFGSAIGALSGALFHRSIGMTDAEKAELMSHLEDGGAALGVMADDFEAEATMAKLAELGGDSKNYVIPEETMSEIEAAADEAALDAEAGEPEAAAAESDETT